MDFIDYSISIGDGLSSHDENSIYENSQDINNLEISFGSTSKTIVFNKNNQYSYEELTNAISGENLSYLEKCVSDDIKAYDEIYGDSKGKN
jgi:hypothetical protein